VVKPKKEETVPGISIPELDEAEEAYRPRGYWSDGDIDILCRYYGKVPTRLLSKHLGGRTYAVIERQAIKMGLRM